MKTGLPADDGAGTGIPAGTGMQTGLSRTSPPVILNFPHVILSAAKDLPPRRLSETGKDPSSAPPPQDDREKARHA